MNTLRALFVASDVYINENIPSVYGSILSQALSVQKYQTKVTLNHSEITLTETKLKSLLPAHTPHILHLSGHGDVNVPLLYMHKKEGFKFRNEPDNYTTLHVKDFLRIISEHNRTRRIKIRLIVIACCFSMAQITKELAEPFDCIIGLKGAGLETALSVFAETFYSNIDQNNTILNSFIAAKKDSQAAEEELTSKGQNSDNHRAEMEIFCHEELQHKSITSWVDQRELKSERTIEKKGGWYDYKEWRPIECNSFAYKITFKFSSSSNSITHKNTATI